MLGIAVTGLARSGKDAVADYIAEKYNFHKLVLSEVLATELQKQGKPDSKMNRSLLGVEIRKEYGNDVLAKTVIETAKEKNWEKVVFSGPQSLAELEYLKKNSEKFILIAVNADPEKRFERRTESDSQSKEEFFARDKHNLLNFDLRAVMDNAAYTISNNSTLDDLHKSIDELMQKI